MERFKRSKSMIANLMPMYEDKSYKAKNTKKIIISVIATIIMMGIVFSVYSSKKKNNNEQNMASGIVQNDTIMETSEDISEETTESTTEKSTEETKRDLFSDYGKGPVENEEEYLIDGEDEYYSGTYYIAPNWYEDDAIVVCGDEVWLGLGRAYWKNSQVPNSYWFIFDGGFMSVFYCYYLSSSAQAREACIELTEIFDSDGKNALGFQKDEAQYWYLSNVLVMNIPSEQFEDMFQKDFYEITMDDVIDYFDDDYMLKYILSEEQAYSAVVNYCCEMNPLLSEMMEEDEEYHFYWYSEQEDENTYLVTYVSYTGAIIYYHVNKYSGETISTEYISGITDEVEGTERFNAYDYF